MGLELTEIDRDRQKLPEKELELDRDRQRQIEIVGDCQNLPEIDRDRDRNDINGYRWKGRDRYRQKMSGIAKIDTNTRQ